ncbi:MAG: class I SAM-dependent methyltransferase [Acidimicrobiales bacterium]
MGDLQSRSDGSGVYGRGNPSPAEVKARITKIFNDAADHFDDPALSFWSHFGARTVEHAQIGPGQRVLDACCGTGSSAIPAARAVGPGGSVLGVDLAERLVDRARAKATAANLGQVSFVTGDVVDIGEALVPSGGFDAVICVFGVFFLPDMAAAAAGLWQLVAPGGVLTLTTWGPRVLDPITSIFYSEVAQRRPDLVPTAMPWKEIEEAESLSAFLAGIGADGAEIETEVHRHPVRPTDFVTIALGSGMRGTLDALGAEVAGEATAAVEAELATRGVTKLVSDVLYARVRRPG